MRRSTSLSYFFVVFLRIFQHLSLYLIEIDDLSEVSSVAEASDSDWDGDELISEESDSEPGIH